MTPVRDAMIVAGGRGTRLRPLTRTTPKPLLPVCGVPFLSGIIRNLADIGVEQVLLVVGSDTSPFDALRPDAARVGVTLESVPEPTPLDTAGGVRAALDRVAGTFLVLNGDILTDLDLPALIDHHRQRAAAATLALTRVEETSAFGVCVRDGDRIVDFVEKPSPGTLPGQDAVNAGTYVLEPDAMARFPQGRLSFERDVFPELVATGANVGGMVSDAVWADLGTPERFLHGHRLILDGTVRWPGATDLLHDAQDAREHPELEVAASAQIRGPVRALPGTRIGADATVGPYVVLGAGSWVGRGATVRDSVVFDDGRLGAGAVVESALLGTGVRLGARVRVGAGSVLGDGLRVADDEALPPATRRPS